LKKEGSATLGNINSPQGVSVSKILPGHYTLESLAKHIDGLFDKYNYKLETNKSTCWPACNQKSAAKND